jgi:PAS domain S-box-containing protein
MSLPGSPWARQLATVTTLAAIFVLGLLSVHLTPPHSEVAGWWPAAGVSVGLLAVAPRAAWPALVAGLVAFTGAANLVGGRELDVSTGFALSNAAEAVVGALVLKSGKDVAAPLADLGDFWRLVKASFLGAAAIALGVILTLATQETFSLPDAGFVVLSHASATLVIAPLGIELVNRDHSQARRAPTIEVVLHVLALATTCLFLFVPSYNLPISFAVFPVLVWGALRLPVAGLLTELLVVSIVSTLSTSAGRGVFGHAIDTGSISVAAGLTISMSFLLVMVLLTLPMSLQVVNTERLLTRMAGSELLFRRNFTQSLSGMLMLEARGDRMIVIDANDAARDLIGDSPELPLVGRFLDRIFTPGHRLRSDLADLLSGAEENWQAPLAIAGRPGSAVQLSINSVARHPTPIYSAQLADLTAERQSQARIEAAERLTSTTLNATHAMILLVDRDGICVRANAATTTISGWSEAELVGVPVWERMARPSQRENWMENWRVPGGEGIPRQVEGVVPKAGGGHALVAWSNDLVYDANEIAQYVVLTGIDVTAERRAAGLMSYLLNAETSTVIVGVDQSGRVMLANAAVRTVLGYDDLVGRPFQDLLDPTQLAERDLAQAGTPGSAEGAAAFETLVSTFIEPDQDQDWTWITATGQRLTMSVTMSGGGPEDSDTQGGWIFVGRDVTEQRMTQTMLLTALEREQEAVQRLKALDGAKDHFVSTVSHELRTPVTSIVGYAEILLDEPHDPMTEKILRTIARNGERLIGLCNDLLAIQAMDLRNSELGHRRIELAELLSQLESAVRAGTRSRQLDLVFDECPRGVGVLGDPEQLDRMLANLLSNAVKFTPDGGRVSLGVRSEPEWVHLTVSDTGIGIPPEDQSQLFQRFFRSRNVAELQIQGTGLGLSIVASIVESHGGTIDLQSALGEGTSFTVHLPRAD